MKLHHIFDSRASGDDENTTLNMNYVVLRVEINHEKHLYEQEIYAQFERSVSKMTNLLLLTNSKQDCTQIFKPYFRGDSDGDRSADLAKY